MLIQKEEDFIFPAPKFNEEDLLDCKEYIIKIPAGRKNSDNKEETIPCLFYKYPNSNNLLILFHCNGMDMFDSFNSISSFKTKLEMNIFIPEYPGYSIYDYPKSSQKCLENSLIIYDFCLKNIKNISEKNIYVLGRSLGTGPSVYLSSKRSPAGTFLLSPYTTFAAVAKNYHTEDFYQKLTQHLRSIDFIDKVECPLCILHGKNDLLIYPEEAEELFKKCEKNNKKELHLIDLMGHNDVFHYLDEMFNIAKKFIEKYCPLEKKQGNESLGLDLDKSYYYY